MVLVQLYNDGPAESFNPWEYEHLPIWRGGVVGEMIKENKPQVFQEVDWSRDENLGEKLRGFHSVMAMPMRGSRLPVSWVLLLLEEPDVWTPEDLEHSMLRTAIIGTLLESQTIGQELESANERIDGEIKQLAELQRSLLPDPLPNIPGLEIAASYEPSGRAGGDLYDFFPLYSGGKPPEQWCIFIGDASGHGAAAAVVMAIVQTILHAHPKDTRSASELLTYANRHLCKKKLGGFVTAFVGIYEPATRKMVYASAGHPPPLVKSGSNGGMSMLDEVASYPLGIDKENRFREGTVQLHPGDTVVMYTDGITEARNPEHEMFELDRLQCAIKSAQDGPEKLIGQLHKAVCEFQRGRSQIDDQTMVAVRSV